MNKKQTYTMLDIQNEVDAYISQFEEGYFSPLSQMARLTEEVGELAREINHSYGEKPKKSSETEKALEEELGDVLFVIACFANSLEIDLAKSFQLTMEKFNSRDEARWTKK